MQPGQTSARFNETRLTLIDQARSGRAGLDALLSEYWSPVYAYLRRKGHKSHDAADLTQAFLAERVIDRTLLQHFDPVHGRFRSYLLRSLNNFVIDQHRKETRRVEHGTTAFVPDDQAALEAAEPRDTDDPAKAFHRQWIIATLDRAARDVERDCAELGMERQWDAYHARVLGPARYGTEPVSFSELRERLGVEDRQEIYSMLQTVKRKLERALKQSIAVTVNDADERERDIEEMRILAGIKAID